MLSDNARLYIDDFQRRQVEWERKKEKLREILVSIVNEQGVHGAEVAARVKSVRSLQEKILLNDIDDPASKIYDAVGIRIILLFKDQVDQVVESIKKELTYHNALSKDKRRPASLEAFGYRSYHLICSLDSVRAKQAEYIQLRGLKFEVQVRSLADHAWAEVEHDIGYKSGLNLPDDSFRRFRSLAAALELVDSEFLRLRDERERLVQQAKNNLLLVASDTDLDIAFLQAGLEIAFPKCCGRKPELIRSHLTAIKIAGVRTVGQLQEALVSTETLNAIEQFAALNSLAPDELSLHALVFCIATAKHPELKVLFD